MAIDPQQRFQGHGEEAGRLEWIGTALHQPGRYRVPPDVRRDVALQCPLAGGHNGVMRLPDLLDGFAIPFYGVSLPGAPPAAQMRQKRRRDAYNLPTLLGLLLPLRQAVEHAGSQIDPRPIVWSLGLDRGFTDDPGSRSHVAGHDHEPRDVLSGCPIGGTGVLLLAVAPSAPNHLGGFLAQQIVFVGLGLLGENHGDNSVVQTFVAVQVDRGPEVFKLTPGSAMRPRSRVGAATVAVDLGK